MPLILSTDTNPGEATWNNSSSLRAAVLMPDPGDAGTIATPTASDGQAILQPAAGVAETRSLAAPAFLGQQVSFYAGLWIFGATIDVASIDVIDSAGNTNFQFTAPEQWVVLEAISWDVGNPADLIWYLVRNDGAILS